jgi:hypothetical protein
MGKHRQAYIISSIKWKKRFCMRLITLFLATIILFSSGGAIAASPDAPTITGTAFFVSDNGMAVTNYHVIKDCEQFMLFNPQVGWTAVARVVDVDVANDLALLQADVKSRPLPTADRFALKRGEEVLTLGYPSPGIQGASQKATFGRINTDSGIGDDIRHVQVDVPLQPGNSGGPLLNIRGEVVGVVNARLKGDFQNVSYAIKVDYLRPLLVKASTKTVATSFFAPSSLPNVVERCQNSVVMVLGYRVDKSGGTDVSQEKSGATPDLAEIQRAAEQGNANAQFALGDMYATGNGVPENEVKAAEWYHKAAEQGHADAQYNLGIMYVRGQGVTKNDANAVEWFSKAAEQGIALAQYGLGLMYAAGQGISKNETKAVEWFHKAAEQRVAQAQYRLGLSYTRGRGVPKNDAKAAEWYRKAAEQNFAEAQYVLGIMYFQGRGTIRDRQKGCALLRTVGEQGYELAIEAYNQICAK